MHQLFINSHPVLPCVAVHYLHGNLLELLLISTLRNLCFYLPAVNVFLEHQQNLVGVHGLYQVVGNLLSDGLLHDILLLTFGHHDNRCGRRNLFDALKSLQSAESWHLLVQQHQVERPLLTDVNGVCTIANSRHVVALFLEKDDVALQLFHLVVYPK